MPYRRRLTLYTKTIWQFVMKNYVQQETVDTQINIF